MTVCIYRYIHTTASYYIGKLNAVLTKRLSVLLCVTSYSLIIQLDKDSKITT